LKVSLKLNDVMKLVDNCKCRFELKALLEKFLLRCALSVYNRKFIKIGLLTINTKKHTFIYKTYTNSIDLYIQKNSVYQNKKVLTENLQFTKSITSFANTYTRLNFPT